MPRPRLQYLQFEDSQEHLEQGGLHSVLMRPLGCPRAFLLRPLLSASEVDALLQLTRTQRFSVKPDSVDGRPAHEVYAIARGKDQHPEICAFLRPLIHNRVLPFIKRVLQIEQPTICTALIRRYQPGARRLHPAHFDAHALATVVVSLSDACMYDGGLYVQHKLTDRRFVQLERGNALLWLCVPLKWLLQVMPSHTLFNCGMGSDSSVARGTASCFGSRTVSAHASTT